METSFWFYSGNPAGNGNQFLVLVRESRWKWRQVSGFTEGITLEMETSFWFYSGNHAGEWGLVSGLTQGITLGMETQFSGLTWGIPLGNGDPVFWSYSGQWKLTRPIILSTSGLQSTVNGRLQ